MQQNHVQKLIREKNHVLGIFIDLSKAFDTISHEKLLYKLDKYSIRGNAHSLIGSYLSNRKQYVSVLGESSDELPVVFGVPQGSVLGPLLFIIYINDIYNSTSVGKFVLFADDTNIFVADKCKLKVFEKANRILESINSYMRCNLLHINIKKCCYMHFTPKQNDIVVDDDEAINIDLGQNKIKLVKEIKFLGVIIDDKLSWKPHTKYLNSKLKCEIGKLNMMKHVIPSELYKNVYLTLFESHLSYGITAWPGGISKNLLQPLFITRKKCLAIKMLTWTNLKPVQEQDHLKTDFYEKIFSRRTIASKPLFHSNNLLTIHNLYKYHCIVELF